MQVPSTASANIVSLRSQHYKTFLRTEYFLCDSTQNPAGHYLETLPLKSITGPFFASCRMNLQYCACVCMCECDTVLFIFLKALHASEESFHLLNSTVTAVLFVWFIEMWAKYLFLCLLYWKEACTGRALKRCQCAIHYFSWLFCLVSLWTRINKAQKSLVILQTIVWGKE